MSEITYTEKDGILYPNIKISEDEQEYEQLGKYGRMTERYLKEHNSVKYQSLLLDGYLTKYLHQIDKQATDMLFLLEKQYIETHPLPADGNFMETWQIRQRARDFAEEIIISELIYN